MSEPVRVQPDELHIASLVVHVMPQTLSHVAQALLLVDDAQVHGTHPDGKLVVTLEGPNAGAIMDKVAQIQQIAGVLNVSLVYQHAEPRHFMNQEVGNDQHPA